MHESPEDLRMLQRQLDESDADAGVHLRSIFRPERRMSAEEVVAQLRGVFVLHLATVTKRGAPFLAPIDGVFYHARFWFGIPPGGLRARHLIARSEVSANYSVGEEICVIVHGTARPIHEKDSEYDGYQAYLREVYGPAMDYGTEHYADRKEEPYNAWINPRRIFAMNVAH